MNLNYYAQRKSVKNGTPQPVSNRYGERAEMERQYHLYCASAATNADGNEKDSIEWGTIEGGAIERKKWEWPVETPDEPVEGE